jgi:glycosyltransferase involved in cell wall biosynthesis
MRICILSYRSYIYSGGQGIYLRYLSRAFTDLGHYVDIISGPPYPELDKGVNLIKLPSLDLYSMSSLRRLFINPRKLNSYPNLVEWLGTISGYFSEPLAFGMRVYNLLRHDQQQYDVIHDNQTMSYGVLKLRKLGYPIVETIHHPVTIDRDFAVKSASLKNKIGLTRWYSFIGMQIKVARQLSHIITVSEMAREHIADVFNIPFEKLKVIYNGIDTEIFSPSKNVRRLDNRLLAVISRDTPVKGLRYLLEALAKLRQKYPLKLVVVGTTLGDGTTEKKIQGLGLEDRVSFTNQLDTTELIRQYRQATITVVPSIYEGFGLPAAEAMACGCPIISSTAGALPEVVGEAGIMIPPADIESLANAIATLIENPDKRKILSQSGRKRILEKFNWAETAKQTLNVYNEAIDYQKHSNSP